MHIYSFFMLTIRKNPLAELICCQMIQKSGHTFQNVMDDGEFSFKSKSNKRHCQRETHTKYPRQIDF